MVESGLASATRRPPRWRPPALDVEDVGPESTQEQAGVLGIISMY